MQEFLSLLPAHSANLDLHLGPAPFKRRKTKLHLLAGGYLIGKEQWRMSLLTALTYRDAFNSLIFFSQEMTGSGGTHCSDILFVILTNETEDQSAELSYYRPVSGGSHL